MKRKRNGWDRARNLASDYVSRHEGDPGALDLKKVTFIARKWLAGFKGDLSMDDVHRFERHVSDLIRNSKKPPVVSSPSVELLNRKIAEKRSGVDSLQPVVLIAISDLINQVGVECFDKYVEIVKSIKDLD